MPSEPGGSNKNSKSSTPPAGVSPPGSAGSEEARFGNHAKMSKWLRVDSNCNRHPRFVMAGPWGAIVAKACWEIAKEYELSEGVLSELYWNEHYLAAWTMFDREALVGTRGILQGMKAAVKAGLIVETENGATIRGWEERQRDAGTALKRKRERDRKAKQRARKKEGDNVGQHGTTRDMSQDVTMSAPNRTGQNRTEQNRTEQNGTEQNPFTPPLPPSEGGTVAKNARVRKPKEPPEEAIEMAGQLRDAILESKPDHKISMDSESQEVAWNLTQAVHLDRLNRLDGVSWERQRKVLDWLPTDDFWPPNISCGTSFRKKFDTMEGKMRRPPRYREPQRKMPGRLPAFKIPE